MSARTSNPFRSINVSAAKGDFLKEPPDATTVTSGRPSSSALLTINEVATRLNISTKSVRRRIANGLIRKVALGGRAVRISPDELHRLTAATPLEEAPKTSDSS